MPRVTVQLSTMQLLWTRILLATYKYPPPPPQEIDNGKWSFYNSQTLTPDSIRFFMLSTQAIINCFEDSLRVKLSLLLKFLRITTTHINTLQEELKAIQEETKKFLLFFFFNLTLFISLSTDPLFIQRALSKTEMNIIK